MNLLAPPPKRAFGTGTIFLHAASGKWRFRTPGRGSVERGPYSSREEAERRLEDALRGIEVPPQHRPRSAMRDLLSTLKRARRLASRCGLTLEQAIAIEEVK